MLLVDDGEAEALEFDIFFDQGVGADDDVDQALRRQLLELRFFARR